VELNASNAASVKIPPGALTPVVTPPQAQGPEGSGMLVWGAGIGILLLLLLLMFVLKKSRNTTTI
jgi:hypothetical protein